MPDQPEQFLHRDRLVWGQYLRGLEPQLSTMWALTEFTRKNGATRVVPGSAAWPRRDRGGVRPILPMPKWRPAQSWCIRAASSTVAGPNTSAADRVGLNIGYSLGWLRQEENQYLSCPPELAQRLYAGTPGTARLYDDGRRPGLLHPAAGGRAGGGSAAAGVGARSPAPQRGPLCLA